MQKSIGDPKNWFNGAFWTMCAKMGLFLILNIFRAPIYFYSHNIMTRFGVWNYSIACLVLNHIECCYLYSIHQVDICHFKSLRKNFQTFLWSISIFLIQLLPVSFIRFTNWFLNAYPRMITTNFFLIWILRFFLVFT